MDVKISYVLPTKRANGKAMKVEEIKHVRLEVSLDNASFSQLTEVPATKTEYVQTDLEFGTWYFRGIVVDQFDQESDPLAGQITLKPGAPGALQELVLEAA